MLRLHLTVSYGPWCAQGSDFPFSRSDCSVVEDCFRASNRLFNRSSILNDLQSIQRGRPLGLITRNFRQTFDSTVSSHKVHIPMDLLGVEILTARMIAFSPQHGQFAHCGKPLTLAEPLEVRIESAMSVSLPFSIWFCVACRGPSQLVLQPTGMF